ncbi:MAG: hypothetical protein IPK07_01840 [Deltaproteobacteria bacterium]|nr:hypothetical protein [Deltaproteobacteria bacterium]
MTRTRIWAVALTCLAALPGCYYFEAQDALGTAESAFESAKTQGLEQSNPYQFYLGQSYLDRARIENKESDFASARDFARKSQAHLSGALAIPAPAAAVGAVIPPAETAPSASAPAAPTTGSGDMEVTPVAPPPAPPAAPREPELVVQPEPENGK